MNIFPIPALRDNYIWLFFNSHTKHTWIVDPGEAAPVMSALHQYGLILKGIFITHHHHDHSGGAPELIRHFPGLNVYASHRSSLGFITHPLHENASILCDETPFKTLEIPGHTLDHMAFYNDKILFSGDTLFSFGCGRVFEGTPEQMYHSLTKLKNLPPETEMYCGHEYTLANLTFAHAVLPDNPVIAKKILEVTELRAKNLPTLPSKLHQEKLLNPFLRCEDQEIISAVENHFQKKFSDTIQIFANLREWKNSFKG
jgi:hydroxyacylglutathione hydrolase